MTFHKLLRAFWVLSGLCLLSCSLWVSSLPSAEAHMTSMGTFVAAVDAEKRQVRLVVTVSRDDLGTYLKLDSNKDKRISWDEMEGHRTQMARYIAERVKVSNNSWFCEVKEQSFLKKREVRSKRRLFLRQVYQCARPLERMIFQNKILFEDTGGYRHVGRIQWGRSVYTTIFSRMFPTYRLNLKQAKAAAKPRTKAKPSSKQATPKTVSSKAGGEGFWKTFVKFLVLGMQHILKGFDHIVFVLCLLVVARTARQLFWVVSAFTLGHSITLVSSALGFLVMPQAITEVLIAITIAYVAVENLSEHQSMGWFRGLMVALGLITVCGMGWMLAGPLFVGKSSSMARALIVIGCLVASLGFFLYYVFQLEEIEPSGHRFWLTGLFGMIHGIGFSYSLQKLNLPTVEMVSALLSFNVGVEVGQIAVILLVFPWLVRIMKEENYPRVVTVFSVVVFGMALHWIAVRSELPKAFFLLIGKSWQ